MSGRVAVITGASSGIGKATDRASLVAAAARVRSELADHITHAPAKAALQTAAAEIAIPAEEIGAAIAFAVDRPRTVSLNEILVRPTSQLL